MTCLGRKEFSCSHWNRDILSTFAPRITVATLSVLFATVTAFWQRYAGMNLLLRIPRYTKLEGCHWLVGCSFKLIMQSMTAVMTPDHLTRHFPSGSGIPAVTLRCQVMSSVEWRWNFSWTCITHWGWWYAFDYHKCKIVNEAVCYGSSSIKATSLSFKLRSLCLCKLKVLNVRLGVFLFPPHGFQHGDGWACG